MSNLPKPTALKLLEGNRGKRPINKDEPKPRPVAPKRPEWLPAEGKREWERVAPELERMGLLTVVDGAALASYCIAWSQVVKAQEKLTRDGLISPYFTVQHRALDAVRKFCVEFGFTPSSRGRMSVGKMDDGEEPAWLD